MASTISLAWDVDADPEGVTYSAHEAGHSDRVLGRASSTGRGWRLEVERDGDLADAGEVRGSYEDAISALTDLIARAWDRPALDALAAAAALVDRVAA